MAEQNCLAKAFWTATGHIPTKEFVAWFAKSEENNLIYTSHNEKQNKDVYMVALRDADKKLIGYYEKHEYRNKENMEKYHMTSKSEV